MSTAPISYSQSQFKSRRLSGNWQVQPISIQAEYKPQLLTSDWADVPECAHLQPVLYPDNPYWGDHIRAINQQAWLYRRTFRLPTEHFQRARLRFEGVDYFAEVWVNDTLGGKHEGHFAPFDVDISHFLGNEDVTLTVRVTAPWDEPNPKGTYPSDHVIRGLVKGLYEHGEGVIPPAVNPIGIWRPVWLLLDQGVSINHVRIQTDTDGQVKLRFRIANDTPDQWHGSLDMRLEAANHGGPGVVMRRTLNLPPGTHFIDHVLQIPEPHFWWCWDQGNPDLYCLEALLLNDEGQVVGAKKQRFGIRTIRLERTPERFTYFLNDRPLFIRGSSYMPALYLSQCNQTMFESDLALARDAHLNLLRVHVHVSPPELYDLCDSTGMLVWQDFELNWIQDTSPQFEQRAIAMQREMIDLLGSHPSIVTWTCHNEPTMVVTRRHNLELRPDPALYADACQQDPTRPVFICSGQIEDDWQRSGDAHSYYGAIWSPRFTDIYHHHPLMNSEFGFETPGSLDTLRAYPDVWERLQHLEGQVEDLWAYQAALIQYHVEHFRRLRASGCAGYVHFWLVDLVPQVGCGVLDACRVPKGGYAALQRASLPLLVSLEHDGRQPIALWVCNDTPHAYPDCFVHWQIEDETGKLALEGETPFDITANCSQQVTPARWLVSPTVCARIVLTVYAKTGAVLSQNEYLHPFQPLARPQGYPWKFDPYLGTKVFDRVDAPSLADQSGSGLVKLVPLSVREALAERMLRQRLPSSVVSRIARLVDAVMG